jgi:TPR repeat protein
MANIQWHSIIRLPLVFLVSVFLLACSDYQQARSAYEAGDYAKAFQIFERLSQAGDNQAQYDLSQMYLQGIGTPKSIEQGWVWMNRAADKGNIQAMLELGVRYQASASLDNGEEMAFVWFQKAAMAGSPVGQYNLAHFYESGKQVPVDLVKAYAWMMLSNNGGNPAAGTELKLIKARLSPSELASANEMIQELKKTLP